MNQQEQNTVSYSVERGDELSLIKLWKVLTNNKLFIIVFIALTTLGAIYYATTLPTIYKANVLMISVESDSSGSRLDRLAGFSGIALGGGNGDVRGEQALARLKTRSFLVNHIKENNLKHFLLADQWSKEEKQWINDKEPSDEDAYKFFLNMITAGLHVRSKANLGFLSIEWEDPANPEKIADIANNLVSSMNSHAKDRAISDAKNSIKFLEKELGRTSILNSQTILYNLIEQQIGKIMMANVRDEFVFKVIDPAVIPKRAEVKQVPAIIFLGLLLGILGAFFLVLVNHYIRKQVKENA
jgi:uncharacterized protein involved in exopolysaccharide biosynthesis